MNSSHKSTGVKDTKQALLKDFDNSLSKGMNLYYEYDE